MNKVSNPKILLLGYQDLVVSDNELKQIFGANIDFKQLKIREDSERIIKWHKARHLSKIYDTFSLFEQLDCELTISDIEAIRGGEIIIDLNVPLKTSNKYNIVFDGGTMEHCFNIGQAIQNIIELTEIDGYILHGNPLQMMNHGFYNISPTLYWDVYNQNGHKVHSLKIQVGDSDAKPVDQFTRFIISGNEAGIYCLAQKLHDGDFVYPIQSKYLIEANARQIKKKKRDFEWLSALEAKYNQI
jgi:hypothetical protein